MFNGSRILIAPLHWGLGHAARCVPIIQRLLELGATPVIGADGGAMALLKDLFPDLQTFTLPGYHVTYSAGSSQAWSMVKQLPYLLQSIRAERMLIKQLYNEHRIDAIISDQRFGVRHDAIPSVLITHQIFPAAPVGKKILHRANHRFIERFDRCWIMDHEAPPGLAGTLSHGDDLPKNTRYIGAHSRLESGGKADEEWHIVAILSGPEPQRSMLEKIILDQLENIDGEHLVIQGLPARNDTVRRGGITMRTHAKAQELAAAMESAEMVVARSGYTTLMDLYALGRGALLIPTPGQPEQEYLATLHCDPTRFLVQTQDNIDLADALSICPSFHGPTLPGHTAALEGALMELATMLQDPLSLLSSTEK